MGFSGRGKPLALWGGTGANPLEKRERGLPGIPDGTCGHPERDLVDPCVVSSTRSGECCFSSSKICARTNGPPERKTALRRGTGKYVWCARCRRVTLPFHGAGLGAKCPRGTTCGKSGKQERSNRKSKMKTYQRKEKYWGRLIIPSWNTGSTEINYFWLIYSAHLICISFQSPWELGLGLGLYFAVTLIPMGPVAMATFCLLPFRLVKSFNWNSTHCSRILMQFSQSFKVELDLSKS